jgi:hypothetical protein
MNLDLDFSAVSRLFRGLLGELRQKKLWPAAVALLAALVAVPILLSKSATPTPVAQAPVPTPPPSPATTLPAISEQSTPAHSRLTGPAHNPFASASGAGGASSAPSPSTVPAAVSTATSTAANTMSALTGGAPLASNAIGGSAISPSPVSGGSTSSPPYSSPSTPPSITGNAKPKPAPSGLSSTQAYRVAVSITASGGGLNGIDPLERLSVLPSPQQPLLVELGVLQGGKRVLFATQPDTVLAGPGSCIPGPVDCEILSLGQDQTEAVGRRLGGLGATAVALFAVTAITAADYPSAAAADSARRSVSAAGRTLLASSNLPTLALFPYEPSLGYLVDLRNLTVGG